MGLIENTKKHLHTRGREVFFERERGGGVKSLQCWELQRGFFEGKKKGVSVEIEILRRGLLRFDFAETQRRSGQKEEAI